MLQPWQRMKSGSRRGWMHGAAWAATFPAQLCPCTEKVSRPEAGEGVHKLTAPRHTQHHELNLMSLEVWEEPATCVLSLALCPKRTEYANRGSCFSRVRLEPGEGGMRKAPFFKPHCCYKGLPYELGHSYSHRPPHPSLKPSGYGVRLKILKLLHQMAY